MNDRVHICTDKWGPINCVYGEVNSPHLINVGYILSPRELLLLQADSSRENSGFVLEYVMDSSGETRIRLEYAYSYNIVLQDEYTILSGQIRLQQ